MRLKEPDTFLSQLIYEGIEISETVEARFGSLDELKLNWKPDSASWSIGQCLDHLMQTNDQYIPVLKRVASGVRESTIWEKISPFSGYFGRYLIKNVGAEVKRKFKSPGIFKPDFSRLEADTVHHFVNHQNRLIELFGRLKGESAGKVIVSSPVSALVTLSVNDCLRLIIDHEKRHLKQAEKILDMPGFPS